MTFSLLIDMRENILREFFDKECFVNLHVADIIIKKDDEILIAIERKTINDLKCSIVDGRWKEQKTRLINNIPNDRIIYLIEGNILKKTSIKGGSKTLIGSTINCMLRDKIMVYKTTNIKETVAFITKIFDSVQKKHKEFFTEKIIVNDYSNSIKIKKKDNINPDVWYKNVLMNIPQVSNTTADVIIKEYPTLKTLVEKNDIISIKNLTYQTKTGKTRKIGPKLAQRICTFVNK